VQSGWACSGEVALRGNISNGVEIGDADARLQLAITHNMERRIRLRRGGRSIFDATIISSYARKVKHIVESGTDGSIKRSRRSFMDRGHGQPLISTRNGGATAAEACMSVHSGIRTFLDTPPATSVHSAMLVQTRSRQPQKVLGKESQVFPANSSVAARSATSTLSSAGATQKKVIGMRG
jgi:hypothetical protein